MSRSSRLNAAIPLSSSRARNLETACDRLYSSAPTIRYAGRSSAFDMDAPRKIGDHHSTSPSAAMKRAAPPCPARP